MVLAGPGVALGRGLGMVPDLGMVALAMGLTQTISPLQRSPETQYSERMLLNLRKTHPCPEPLCTSHGVHRQAGQTSVRGLFAKHGPVEWSRHQEQGAVRGQGVLSLRAGSCEQEPSPRLEITAQRNGSLHPHSLSCNLCRHTLRSLAWLWGQSRVSYVGDAALGHVLDAPFLLWLPGKL